MLLGVRTKVMRFLGDLKWRWDGWRYWRGEAWVLNVDTGDAVIEGADIRQWEDEELEWSWETGRKRWGSIRRVLVVTLKDGGAELRFERPGRHEWNIDDDPVLLGRDLQICERSQWVKPTPAKTNQVVLMLILGAAGVAALLIVGGG